MTILLSFFAFHYRIFIFSIIGNSVFLKYDFLCRSISFLRLPFPDCRSFVGTTSAGEVHPIHPRKPRGIFLCHRRILCTFLYDGTKSAGRFWFIGNFGEISYEPKTVGREKISPDCPDHFFPILPILYTECTDTFPSYSFSIAATRSGKLPMIVVTPASIILRISSSSLTVQQLMSTPFSRISFVSSGVQLVNLG